jgi:uncharacterized protein (DUF1778 family)
MSAQEAAQRLLQEESIVRLGVEDRVAFVDALLNPPVLKGRLAKALDRYRHFFS